MTGNTDENHPNAGISDYFLPSVKRTMKPNDTTNSVVENILNANDRLAERTVPHRSAGLLR
jgi:hypothetical protein